MKRYKYDLHIHTCLSPCGDNEMTPHNIVTLAELIGCEILAVTDHNSCKNAAAVMETARDTDLLVIPGMELCVSEEAHVICLFETIDGALEFDKYVTSRMPSIVNRAEVFGEQRICSSTDEVIGVHENMLLLAADISVNDTADIAAQYGGCVFPAHIDRSSYSVVASLGAIPPEAKFTAAELSSGCNASDYISMHPELSGMQILRNSDAHYLEVFAGEKHDIDLSEKSVKALFEKIHEGVYRV